ncbi:hypothetical protein OPV22_007129 [Ensete ventricosum]|uniref:Uncharacterized protein n=1 Tax=Ensete ventricosum TaxID=4639 RepID=A0AAV8RR43_ENSVE|nr:hypothetical protein OPV22_007129 [Ensete ventricosum]
MSADEEIAASGTHGKRRRRSGLLSCFRASLVSDTTEAKASESLGVPGKRPRWWEFREKKKTVPVNVVGDATPTRGKGAPKPGNSDFRHRFQKDNGTEGGISTTRHVHQPQRPTVGAQNPRARHVTSRCKTRTEPAPTYRVPDRTRTGTRTSHPGSPEPGRHAVAVSTHVKPPTKGAGELDSAAGLSSHIGGLRGWNRRRRRRRDRRWLGGAQEDGGVKGSAGARRPTPSLTKLAGAH